MNNRKPKAFFPELRFPEFQGMGGWEHLNANELFQQISNKDHDSDLPILAITQEHGAIPRELIDYNVTATEKSIKSYKVVEVGDFIISLRSFQGGIEYSKYKGICSPAYVILRKTEGVNEEFFKHYFKSERFIRDLTKNLEGLRDGKMISYKQFSDVPLPLPSLKEQQKVCECLSSISTLITAQHNNLEALQSHKKGLMQKLFPEQGKLVPKLRFSEFKNEPVWSRMPFNEVFSRIKTKNKENNKNVLTISAQQGLVSQLDYFNKSVSSNNLAGYYLLHRGDFAYNKSYSKGYPMGAIKPLKLYEKGVVSTLYICFRANNESSVDFFSYYFDSGLFNSQIEQYAQEGARNHGLLNIGVLDFFNGTEVLLPSENEQQKIAHFLMSIDKIITTQSQKLDVLVNHKKALIQKIFPSREEEYV